ncbi:Ribosome biogenesis protein SLX9 [Madurella fahalii]|uniref:Ribosome biogenesis protein SLX9 n=1 Tax=Madurella fahalii TaxID=1157608 RepID=A0ABQ0FZ90_9PEZI
MAPLKKSQFHHLAAVVAQGRDSKRITHPTNLRTSNLPPTSPITHFPKLTVRMAPIAPAKPKPSSGTSAGTASTTAKTAAAAGAGKRLTARQKARARLADPLLPRKLHRENNVVADGFINSKRDKRLIKHSAFVSRITKPKASSSSAATHPGRKRRRPSKKLVATLESLGDALDDIKEAMDAADEEEAAKGGMAVTEGKIRHKSLKSRPGALRRKEKVVRGEMERFGRSLAQLSGISGENASTGDGGGGGGGGGGGDAAVEGKEMDTEMAAAGGEGGKRTQAQPTSSATSNRWAALRGFISATMEQNPAFLGKT